MCGIAGVLDLAARRPIPPERIEAMAQAIVHRGPDEDGFFHRPGLAMANRRLSIVGLADGKQPIHNEDRSISVVFNGELFDYPELRKELEGRGHVFRTHCDTELIPHLYEELEERMFDRLRGQFAIALWDEKRQKLILARDRFGICPLHWSQQGDWLLFGSEIRALLASGMVTPRADRRGIDQIFSFFASPGPYTCFEGVQQLLPGQYLRIQLGQSGESARITKHQYWDYSFPDRGQEERGDPKRTLDQFEQVLLASVERRLRADVPVVSYLSGGVDSSMIVALACKVLGRPIPTFTIRIEDPNLDEVAGATLTARHVGAEPFVVKCGAEEILNYYPRLIETAETPVVDTSCTALMQLAHEVHAQGYKVALTGEGSDEWLAGYPWFKYHKIFNWFDAVPGVRLSNALRSGYIMAAGAPRSTLRRLADMEAVSGGPNAYLEIWTLMGLSKWRFYSDEMQAAVKDFNPLAESLPNQEGLRRWDPLHRSLYVGARIQLAGLLLHMKGDRVAMHSSVETRYPFLDEEVFAFLSKLHPSMKLNGFTEKYLLRQLAERWLPHQIAWRKKAMFRAPFDSFHLEQAPPYVTQLLSPESLRKAGYFDPVKVRYWQQRYPKLPRSPVRTTLEMGLAAVTATQLWHQRFIDPSLADVPVSDSGRGWRSAGHETNGTFALNGTSRALPRAASA